jgi:hypothetical protein
VPEVLVLISERAGQSRVFLERIRNSEIVADRPLSEGIADYRSGLVDHRVRRVDVRLESDAPASKCSHDPIRFQSLKQRVVIKPLDREGHDARSPGRIRRAE